jgi:hypothetical protein
LRYRWKCKRDRIRAVIREVLKDGKKMSKNKCIAAVQKREKMGNGRSSSPVVIADELDKMAAEGDSIVKQYNGRRSEGAWYTIMPLHATEIVYMVCFEHLMASIEVKLNELRHSYPNLSKVKTAKRVTTLLRTCEYLSLLASSTRYRSPEDHPSYRMISELQNDIDNIRKDILDFINVDLGSDYELRERIDTEYPEAKPKLELADSEQALELWEKAEKKPLWYQLSKCGGRDDAVELLHSVRREVGEKMKRTKGVS